MNLQAAATEATLTLCTKAGCQRPRISKQGMCAQHYNAAPGSGQFDLATGVCLAVKWEGTSATLAQVAFTTPMAEMTLTYIDTCFRALSPSFATRRDFAYVWCGEKISSQFHDVFDASVFERTSNGNIIHIRKIVDEERLVAAYVKEGTNGRATMAPRAAAAQQGGGAKDNKNPFKRVAKEATEEKKAPVVEVKKPYVHARAGMCTTGTSLCVRVCNEIVRCIP
jgi:hypothetical protein